MKISTKALWAAAAVSLGGAVMTAEAASSPAARPSFSTPLSLLQIMRANVEIPADGIWAASSSEKLSDQEWLLAEQDATNVIASASFVAVGGTGPKDKGWVANADWKAWTKDLQATGVTLLAAAKAKDQMKFANAGDHLDEVCEACHAKYRPESPSDGVGRFPFYPPRMMKP